MYTGAIRDLAENLHILVGYNVKDPKSHEFTFLLLIMIMQLAESAILSKAEEKSLVQDLSDIRDSLLWGSLRLNKLEERLVEIVKKIQDENAKSKILCSMIELEHLVIVSPSQDKHSVAFELFEEKISPLREALQGNLTSIEATWMYKTLEEAKKEILSNQKSPDEALESISQQALKILRGGL